MNKSVGSGAELNYSLRGFKTDASMYAETLNLALNIRPWTEPRLRRSTLCSFQRWKWAQDNGQDWLNGGREACCAIQKRFTLRGQPNSSSRHLCHRVISSKRNFPSGD